MAFLLWIIRSLAGLLGGVLDAEPEAAFRGAWSVRMSECLRRYSGVVSFGKGEMMVRLVLKRWGFGGIWMPVPAVVIPPNLRIRCSKAFPSGRSRGRSALSSRDPANFSPPALSVRR
ncbi:MAG: hypothetical protein JXB10_04800 [Pirellulales bacterium]|nr:hypothetical protein [Pirellulales bacterium]